MKLFLAEMLANACLATVVYFWHRHIVFGACGVKPKIAMCKMSVIHSSNERLRAEPHTVICRSDSLIAIYL